MKCTMKLVKETKGAICYNEIDDKGNVKDMMDANTMIGTLYIRKASEIGSGAPKKITVEVL